MGSFVYMIARDDADIIEEKRPEFEERLEKVFGSRTVIQHSSIIILKMMYGKTQDITTKMVAFTQKRLAGRTLRVL